VPTFTTVPVVVNAAVRAVTFVPKGRLTAMVLAGSLITPGYAGKPTKE